MSLCCPAKMGVSQILAGFEVGAPYPGTNRIFKRCGLKTQHLRWGLLDSRVVRMKAADYKRIS